MKEISKPIITDVGRIWGRDAIFLDKVNMINEETFQLIGEFNGTLCSNIKNKEYIRYNITFKNVILFKMIELDFDESNKESSFDEVENSNVIVHLKNKDNQRKTGKIDDSFKHYIFSTYDTVFEIIGKSFELILN